MVSSEKPNEVLQIHTDHLGTPRAVSNARGEILWRWEGEAFGVDSPTLAKVKMPLRFAGQYADDETGLFYNYFRFYDPYTGRYVENDPIDLAGGLNRYGYVGGNPSLKVDPRGLVEWNGTVLGGGFSIPVGVLFDFYTLHTDCINGKRGFARVMAGSGTMGFGTPISIGGGSVTFEDNLSEVNPNVFNGVYAKFAYGFGFGLTVGGSQIQLGNARTSLGSLSPSLGAGLDMSVSGSGGRAKVLSQKVETCGCEL